MSTTPRNRLLAPAALLAAGLLVGSTVGAVAGAKVTGADVKDGSLSAADLNKPSRDTFSKIQGYQRLRAEANVPNGENGQITKACPKGKVVIGGGGGFYENYIGVQFAIDGKGRDATAYGLNDSGQAAKIFVDVVCANVGAVKGFELRPTASK